MNRNWNETGEGMRHEAEETLRLVAALPPPEELTDRVHARVHARLQTELQTPARRGFWAYWLPAQRFQFAAAAALVVAVVGSSWTVYHRQQLTGAGTQTARPAAPVPASGQAGSPAGGAFGTASGVRVPPTLHPILVPPKPAPHRKPGAGHAAAKPKSASQAAPQAVAPAPQPPAVQNQ